MSAVYLSDIYRGVIAAALLAAGGCAVGPDYATPDTAPAEFRNAAEAEFTAAPVEAEWWRRFGDPVLDDLVARALAGSPDLRIAEARVAQARAVFTEQKLDYAPAVTAHAGLTRQDSPVPQSGSFAPVNYDVYDAGFDAAWELDVFGRVRRGVEAARADAEAAEADYRAAAVRLSAEVAREYFALRGAQQRLDVARDNLENQAESLRLTRVRLELGVGQELDVASATARLKETEALVPPLVLAEKRSAHRLAVLLGQRPGELDPVLIPAEARQHIEAIPIGDPADLLRRRPDVLAAERRLAAQTARIGVATADLFPRLSVTGFVGFVSGSASSLGDSDSEAWLVAPRLDWAAFDLGSARARLRAAEAGADAELAGYEQVVLLALEETENAFVAYAEDQRRLAALVERAGASRRAAELARIQYEEGATDFLRLLDAESTVLDAEDAVTAAQTALNTDVVAIYKALGGGWNL
ncbi:MAG TPA: efflux transporter outer membrane subunit [Woeseiaceae bacterium]|nr:efflux transporter outer membrane subunit [Woeseiaceae bacterium]